MAAPLTYIPILSVIKAEGDLTKDEELRLCNSGKPKHLILISFLQSCNFLPFHFLRKGLDNILINPERHISSTANSSRTRSIVLSNSERLPYNL